jgi:hypothetical protein
MKIRFNHLLKASMVVALSAASGIAFSQSSETNSAMAGVKSSSDAGTVQLITPNSSKNRFSVSWGWNRSGYSNSDIHFTGQDHNFTLTNVHATDKPSPFTADTYFNPGNITLPQTNARIAYQWDEDTAIALNLDHMKYVVKDNQNVNISGQIKGVNQSGTLNLNPNSFGHYEHTDGLNILSLEYEKQKQVDWFGAAMPSRLFALVGAGLVYPKSNVTLAITGRPRNDQFHLAGYSLSTGVGLEVDVWSRFFVRTTAKAGFVGMPDVRTSSLPSDKASQSFAFAELILALGVRF